MSSWVEKNRQNNGNLTLDRAGTLNVVRTEAQVRPHDGFKQTALQVFLPVRRETAGERTPILAKPPAWTEVGEMPCLPTAKGRLARAHMDKWDTASELDAAALCAGCPVQVNCLAAAIEEERGLGGSNRYLVRGGLTPHGRVRLERQMATEDGGAA